MLTLHKFSKIGPIRRLQHPKGKGQNARLQPLKEALLLRLRSLMQQPKVGPALYEHSWVRQGWEMMQPKIWAYWVSLEACLILCSQLKWRRMWMHCWGASAPSNSKPSMRWEVWEWWIEPLLRVSPLNSWDWVEWSQKIFLRASATIMNESKKEPQTWKPSCTN